MTGLEDLVIFLMSRKRLVDELGSNGEGRSGKVRCW